MSYNISGGTLSSKPFHLLTTPVVLHEASKRTVILGVTAEDTAGGGTLVSLAITKNGDSFYIWEDVPILAAGPLVYDLPFTLNPNWTLWAQASAATADVLVTYIEPDATGR
jgi:hypothetical protein